MGPKLPGNYFLPKSSSADASSQLHQGHLWEPGPTQAQTPQQPSSREMGLQPHITLSMRARVGIYIYILYIYIYICIYIYIYSSYICIVNMDVKYFYGRMHGGMDE